MVGATGFEPATSWSQTRRSTKLSYTPNSFISKEIRLIDLPGMLDKTGERLFRCRPSDGYYARIMVGGKEIRFPLEALINQGGSVPVKHDCSSEPRPWLIPVRFIGWIVVGNGHRRRIRIGSPPPSSIHTARKK